MLLKFLVTRKPNWRAQLKPETYCASITWGNASVRLSMPCVVSVSKLHCWPPVKVQPLLRDACAQNWR